VLETHHAQYSSSKARFCEWLEIERDDKVDRFLDLCFDESRSKIQAFLDSQQSFSVQLPDSFPDSEADEDGTSSLSTGPNDLMNQLD